MQKGRSILPNLNLWAMSGEIGLMLALPLVVFILIGVKLDRYFNTLPLFIIISLLFSATVSTVAITRKIKALTT